MKYFKDRNYIMSLRLSDDEMHKLKKIRLYYDFGNNTKTIVKCIEYCYRSIERRELMDNEN